MKKNLWKSMYTGEVYEMPTDWMPKFDGWELIGTVEKKVEKTLDKQHGMCYNTNRKRKGEQNK